jgi:hypothetical protein
LWFLCEKDIHDGAAAKCSESFGSLASFDSNNLHLVGEYLEHIQVRSTGISYVTIGLSRKDKTWVWSDGKVYNDSRGILGNSNNVAFLTWNEKAKEWELMGAELASLRLHLCEKSRGNIAHILFSIFAVKKLETVFCAFSIE